MSRQRNRRILFASGAGLVQRAVQLLTTLITLPLVLHSLGVAGFGVWGAATSLAWLSGMLDLGLGSALVTLLPRSLAEGTPAHARAYVTAALFGGGALSLLILAGGFAALAASDTHAPSAPFLIAGVALILNIPLGMAGSLWLGLQRGDMGAWWQLAQTLLTLALLVAAALAGGGVAVMVAAVYGAMLLANAASLLHVLLRHAQLRPLRRVSRVSVQAVLSQGGLFFAINVAVTCTYAFDNLITLDWLGADASAQMAIAMRVCITAIGMIGVITQPFWPGFADALAVDDTLWIRRMLRLGTLGVALLALAGSATLVAFGAPVLRLWLHQDLNISPALLWAMAAWITLLALPQIPGQLLNATLQLRPQAFVLALAAAAGLVLKYFAAMRFGVVGILAVSPLLWLVVVVPVYARRSGLVGTAAR
jgi:O-antigen/teichoic acid export membrane protein